MGGAHDARPGGVDGFQSDRDSGDHSELRLQCEVRGACEVSGRAETKRPWGEPCKSQVVSARKPQQLQMRTVRGFIQETTWQALNMLLLVCFGAIFR